MVQIKIRPAEADDDLMIEKILGSYFLDRDDIPASQFTVAENEDGKVIGCACYDISQKEYDGRRFGEVHTIAVMPSFKDKGTGKRLLKEILRNLAREKDRKDLSDTVYVRTTAPGFFRHEGFSDCSPDLKKGLWDECLNCREYNECVQKILSGKLSELLKE
ncbi:MAG: GNAT family N-acetyltransferase [Methanosarcinaceae archaeon]|nr:GNAT family N-acetyltransferase [Methanosarcinaceae archaeon]